MTSLENITPEAHFTTEWLLTNGIGGFACGCLVGAPRRRHHSLLTAALHNPYGRTIMLNYVADSVLIDGKNEYFLSQLKFQDDKKTNPSYLVEFRLEDGLPIWKYNIQGVILEKSYLLIHRQNTLHMSYKLLSKHENVELKWRPFFHFRNNEHTVNAHLPDENYQVKAKDFQYEIECPHYPVLRIYNESPFQINFEQVERVFYEIEAERGYESIGSLKSPGFFQKALKENEKVTYIVSTEDWNTIFALTPKDAWISEKRRKRNLLKLANNIETQSNVAGKLVLAADQFIISPTSRFDDIIRLQALGEEVKTIIAGFPWFTDWGRDTMISLEGLTLATGRHRDAYAILHTFAYYVRNGLIPNMFPDGKDKGIYNTADATLWFFHAINRYIEVTKDEEILEFILPRLHDIIQHHVNGTLFGIKMDSDGLLTQGQKGVQLTWMDAKVGEWVVTPRRGKAVEINALWYNALKLYEKWSGKSSDLSSRCFDSFNQKFWFEEGKYLYDVIEGENGDNDSALRPNQLFAISLDYPVLKEDKWLPVLNMVEKHLLTPMGLRTLSPYHPDYKATYNGDLRARDAAYHQGTVWPWLLGPFIDVWLKVHPHDYEKVSQMLKGLEEHLNNNCMDTICEIFDASPPFTARGCFAQAWSVAEVLRILTKIVKHKS